MKKMWINSFAFILTPVTLLPIVSCSSSSSDYKEMSFIIDVEKLKSIKDVNRFNGEEINKDKLLKIIKNNDLDRYTYEAMGYTYKNGMWTDFNKNKNLFSKIEIEDPTKNPKLVIELKKEYSVSIDGKEKKIKNVFRLPNGSLELTKKFNYE